ncbi:MAG: hypothetical protein ACXAEU_12800 [Candidatus Hodarchaeales archaeon]|jgi:hypothetical protein
MSHQDFFDIIVLDTNFFINLEEVGLNLLPQLDKILQPLRISCSVPSELPRTDIPSAFRQLRHKIPKHVPMVDVNRRTNFWQKCAEVAQKRRMVNSTKDPADIDVVVLAKMHQKKGKRVAVVSDDQGVVRIVQELKPFSEISALSSGAFLSMLSATIDDPQLRESIDKGAKNVFRKSWSYKKKSRSYIDIDLLVEDLTDTAMFVRSASETLRKRKLAAVSAKDVLSYDVPVDEPIKVDKLEKVSLILNEMRKLRDDNNLVEAEAFVYKLPKLTAELIVDAEGAEEKVIYTQLLFSELFEHHTWSLDYRLKREGLIEALAHSEAIISFLPFINVGEEVVENVLALHGLLLLLLGRTETAFNVVTQIPYEPPISSTQLLSFVLVRVARGESEEAKKLLDDNKESVDLSGMIDSINKYANQCFTNKREDFAIDLLTFLLNNFQKEKALLVEPADKLYRVSRLSPHKITDRTQENIQKIIGHKLEDNSKVKIPRRWRKTPFEIDPEDPVKGVFSENYSILLIETPPDREEVHVVSWGSKTNSLWKIVFPLDMKPALEYAKSFKLNSGTVKKIVRRSPFDLKTIRGSIHVKDPVLQIDIDIPWSEN